MHETTYFGIVQYELRRHFFGIFFPCNRFMDPTDTFDVILMAQKVSYQQQQHQNEPILKINYVSYYDKRVLYHFYRSKDIKALWVIIKR